MLKDIKTVKCPICGCTEIVSESLDVSQIGPLEPQIQQHCNGGRWEHRKFLCGYEVEYIPNYGKENKVSYSECFYDPEVVARKKKLQEDKDRLVAVLKENDISTELIKRVILNCLH
jgi:hypothetical protein